MNMDETNRFSNTWEMFGSDRNFYLVQIETVFATNYFPENFVNLLFQIIF